MKKIISIVLSVTILLTCSCGLDFNIFANDTTASYFAPTVTPDIHLDMSDKNNFGKDASGNGNNATVVGNYTVFDGPDGDAAITGFTNEGNKMYIEADGMTFANDFSVSVTFNAGEISNIPYDDQMLVVKRDRNAGLRDFQLCRQSSDNTLIFIVRNASNKWVWCYGPEVTVGEWHTAVATVKDNQMQLYYDGVLVDTAYISGGRFAENDAPIGIGGDPNDGSCFNGAISDVKISDNAAIYPELQIITENSTSVEKMQVGNLIFSDRDSYFWSNSMPEFFKEMYYNLGCINGGSYTVKKGGLLYALTPDETQEDSASQEATLRKIGFTRLEGLDFQAFGIYSSDYVHAYCKQVTAGEVLNIGKWVILIADNLKVKSSDYIDNWTKNTGELLYNGITLPEQWPPTSIEKYGNDTLPVPYLTYKPDVININTGRQLFVDDFLIEATTLTREWHKAEKYDGNPVLKPETTQELGRDQGNGTTFAPMAAPFSGGVWYDSTDQLFKMWYCAGWFDGTALATSKDGINWERAEYDVEPGTNLVIPLRNAKRDSASVVMDPFSKATERFKMFLWSRPDGGEVYTSADGIHWGTATPVASTGDRTTIFYNPFRNKWVYSIRSGWSDRSRSYSECDDLIKGADLKNTVNWARADSLDIPEPGTNTNPALYNLDAVAYESVMLGAFCIYLGPSNEVCHAAGTPKLTELHMGFSRDGFHWSRSDDRTPFIGATKQKGSWERGYIHSNSAICIVNDDELWFYYTGFEGDESKAGYDSASNGMYANASTGLATLRRDGFASMNAINTTGTLTTEAVTFNGKYLFINAEAENGSVKAEILDENGNVIEGYSLDDCIAVTKDTTKAMLKFPKDLSSLSGKNVKFRFTVENGKLYSFWITDDADTAASNGYLAGGSVGQKGLTDSISSYEIKGDVNNDGKIDSRDLVRIKKISLGILDYTDSADINDDGACNAADISTMRNYLLGIINKLK